MKYEQMDNGKEIWKNIKGYYGQYQISNWGRVRSQKYGNFRIRKPFIAGKGYLSIDLCKKCKYKKFYLHRLVAIYFIPNPLNLPEVNHKDGNKKNNHISNLNWTDGVGNMKHAIEELGFVNHGENAPAAKLTEKQVRDIIEMHKSGNYTYAQIADRYNIKAGHAWNIVKGVIWKHLKIA